MAKATIHGESLVVTSALKVKDIALLQSKNPKALVIKDEKTGDQLYKIGMGACASLSQSGAVFTGANKDGNAEMTLPLTGVAADKRKETAIAQYDFAVAKLDEYEASAGKDISATAAKVAEAAKLFSEV